MKKKIDENKITFGDFIANKRRGNRTSILEKIDKTINWVPLKKLILKHFPNKTDAVGNPAYPAFPLFKAIFLQRLYDLSDVQLEYAIADRLSFAKFMGMSVEDPVPDSSTICRFRTALLEKKLSEKLHKLILDQLMEKGLSLKKGINVDASVIESSRHPRKVIDIIPVDRKETETENPTNSVTSDSDKQKFVVTYSDDPDATWLVKGGKPHFGYKLHMGASAEDGFVLGGHVTSANVSDMRELPQLLTEIPHIQGTAINGDKGYTSEANRKAIEQAGFVSRLMYKAARNKPLSDEEKKKNYEISSVRSGIERIFGHMKRNLGFSRTRYIGIDKVTQQFFITAMAVNLVRAVNLLCL